MEMEMNGFGFGFDLGFDEKMWKDQISVKTRNIMKKLEFIQKKFDIYRVFEMHLA